MRLKEAMIVGGFLCASATLAMAQETKTDQKQAPANPAPATAQPKAEPAKQAPVAAQPEKKVKAKKSRLYGRIEAVDQAAKKVSIKTKKGEIKEIVLAETTKLTRGGNREEITISDLKEKNRVEVTLQGDAVLSLHVRVRSR